MISATIIVKNGERHLAAVLSALKMCDEVFIFDTGSTDATLSLARSFANTTLYQGTLEQGFGHAHNQAAQLAKHEWILSIDADEVVSAALAQEIASLPLDPHTVYNLPFHNFFNGKWIKWCGWYPESHIRLYNKTMTSFSEARVHEGVQQKQLRCVTLKNPIYHYSYTTISDFLTKMERYSTLFAQQYCGKKRSSFGIALYHGLFSFFKSFVLKRGFLGGKEGLLISAYNGQTAFYKYLKLNELNHAIGADVSQGGDGEVLQPSQNASLSL